MLTLTGKKRNQLPVAADNRTGFNMEELLEPHVSNDNEPCCFGGVLFLVFWKYPEKSCGEGPTISQVCRGTTEKRK